MIKTLKHLLLLLFVSLLAMACREDKEDAALTEEEPVNLTVSLKVPRIELTRGVSDDPRNKKNTWNEWEELVDGRKLYHVTLFLIERTSKRLVGIRDIEYGSDHITDATNAYGANGFSKNGVVDPTLETAEEVTFTFNYDHPRHGDCEKLRRGEFLLLVVANHTDRSQTIDNTTYTYDGLKNAGGTTLESLVESIKTTFDVENGKGIDDFTQANSEYTDFFDFPIIANSDYLCDKNAPQPLSLVQNISLNPGDNHVEGDLKRTYSRVRIEVLNNSSTADLMVHDLSFSNNFAQGRTFLFVSPDDSDRPFVSGFDKGDPNVASATAITPYVNDGSGITIATGKSRVLFDAYILESQDEVGYNYTLDVEYEGKTYTKPTDVSSTEMTIDELENSIVDNIAEGTPVVIKNIRSGKLLYQNTINGTDYIYQGVTELTGHDKSYLWKFVRYDGTKFKIMNLGSENWVKYPESSYALIVAQTNDYFELESHNNGGFHLKANGEKEISIYLNDYQGSNICGYAPEDDAGSNFYFYTATLSDDQVEIGSELATLEQINEVVGSNTYVLIKNIRQSKYLYQNGTILYQGQSLDKTYLWKLIQRNDGGFYLVNIGSNAYVGYPSDSQTSMASTSDAWFMVKEHSSGGFLIQAYSLAWVSTYLNDYAQANLCGYSVQNDAGSNFNFYLYSSEELDARYDTPIELEIIDPVTAHVSPVTSIKRNDFIDILVTVSLDEMNGDFKFVVAPWIQKEWEFEFN